MRADIAALLNIDPVPIEGQFFRYIRKEFSDEPLSMIGAFREGRRYNVANLFGALYLGFDRVTCEAEVSQGITAGLPFKKGVFAVWQYDVNLACVVRLDDPNVQAAIGVSQEDITIQGNHWTASGVGEPLFNRGNVEGLVAPSAQLPEGKCLDIFLDRLQQDSLVNPVSRVAFWP